MTTEQITDKIYSCPLSELESLIKELPASELDTIAGALSEVAIKLLRKATYLEERGAYGNDHAGAVKEQNKVITKVRRALGYSYPKHDVNF